MAFGEQVATYWKAVGINAEVVFMDRLAWQAMREGGKMKDGAFIDPTIAPTIGGRLSYLFSAGNYGNYPDIQALWDQYRKEVAPKARKELIGRVQIAHPRKNHVYPSDLEQFSCGLWPQSERESLQGSASHMVYRPV